ncbi:MAG TPA: hypothetical protein VGP93_00760, partial [Polyangiaceae bacterium]|nr:hypothetical protein [Polyangiaceae bacterium]
TLQPARGDSQRAIWVQGNGFEDWGVAFGIAVAACVDASAYTGITFWTLSKATMSIEFNIGTYDTMVDQGCTASCDGKYKTTLALPAEWKEWTIPFDSLMATGAATAIPFEANKITAINFIVGPMATFDLYVDDVSFY